MFRKSSEPEFEQGTEGGTRFLFQLDSFSFQDAIDGKGALRHFVIEHSYEEPLRYETDRGSMYELMARFLAGEYEKEEYDLEISPAHEALLDLLELATARARGGDDDFSLEQMDGVEELEEELEEEDPGPGGDDAARS